MTVPGATFGAGGCDLWQLCGGDLRTTQQIVGSCKKTSAVAKPYDEMKDKKYKFQANLLNYQ